MRLFCRFRTDKTGNVALAFGLGTPLLFGSVGIAVDYASWIGQTAMMQKAADAAALAAARELNLGAPRDERIQAIAEGVVAATFTPNSGDSPVRVKAHRIKSPPDGKQTKEKAPPPDAVRVTLWQRKTAILSRFVTPELTDIEVSATAVQSGNTRVCVIGLDEAAADTIRLDDSARISAPDCSVHSNSRSPKGMRSDNHATMASLRACTAGGYSGLSSNYRPSLPVTDCPKTRDPLAERPPPAVGGCRYENLVVEAGVRILDPGTYCGGLKLEPGAIVWLNPGVYVIKDGPLHVGPPLLSVSIAGLASVGVAPAVMKGNNVGFYFTGTVAPDPDGRVTVLRFMKESVVELTAPKTGPMAGLLFHEDRTGPPDRRYEIVSDSARRLVGTIYLPRGVMSVSANQTVADRSEYTAVVTRRLELFKAPDLVLNARYADTDIPVPDGLGPYSGAVRLTK